MVKSAKDLTGTIIAQKYKLLKLLGEGGMGTVYQAQDVLVNRTVALKVLKSETDNEEAVRRFQREATIAARIDSPYCVGLLDFGVADDRPFLVMPYVDGRPLSDVIDDGPLPPQVAIDIFLQICEGLEAAHLKGVVHRDIKPSNVILIQNENGYAVKILDFGIAKLREPDATAARTMTGTGEFLGSPKYMSPEQCEGLPADQRSDIYSLGILMYETLTGDPPFKDENVFAIIEKHRNATPSPLYLTGSNARQNRAVQRIIFRCLEKIPSERYKQITDLRRDLELIGSNNDWLDLRLPMSRNLRTNFVYASLFLLSVATLTAAATISLPSFLIFEPSIERRQIDLQLPHDPILSEFDKNNKDKYFKFKLSTAKSLEGDASPSYLKVCEKAGDFFKGQNDPSNAMKYYGPAAVCLNKMGLVKSVELAELYIKEAECCVPLHYELAFQGDRLTEALDILRPTIEDAFGAVEYLRASCLMAQTDLALAALRDSSSSVRLNRAEVAFQNVVHVYDAYIAPKKELSPLYLVPTLSAAGDYFYRRARTAKDGDAVARSIKNSRRAFKGAIDQSEGNEQYISALISSWNRLGMVEMLARNYDEAILDLRNALRLLDKAREEPANARAVILSNLSDCYLSLKDYGNWLKIRLELARFGKTS